MVMPLYSLVDLNQAKFFPVEFARNCSIDMGNRHLTYDVFTAVLPGSTTDVYFIHCPELYHRETIYTDAPDEHLRFALLNRAAIELCQRMGWAPDIFHLNDWQTALIPI